MSSLNIITTPRNAFSANNLNLFTFGLNSINQKENEFQTKKIDSVKSLIKPKDLYLSSDKNYVSRIIYRENLLSEQDSSFERKSTQEDSICNNDDILGDNDYNCFVPKKYNDWNQYFDIFYVDACENHEENYDHYLKNSLKLLILLPKINWEKELAIKRIKIAGLEKNKKLLVVDLDETLIHSDMDFNYDCHDKLLKIKNNDTDQIIPLIIRPKLYEFLEYSALHFEIVVFTASCKEYADTILDFLDPNNKYFKHRLYRDSCLFLEPGIYIKDLSIFENIPIENIIILDNCLLSFAHHLENGILVSSFYCDSEDTVLDNVIGYLDAEIKHTNDVRKTNSNTFKFSDYKLQLADILKDEIDQLKNIDL